MTASSRLYRWSQHIAWLERGPWEFDSADFDNDVTVRCMIDEVVARLTPRQQSELAGLDARFMQLTQPSSSALICGHDEKRDDWWLHRVPATMSVSAFEQFRSIGYL